MDSTKKLLSDQKLLRDAQYQDQVRKVIIRLTGKDSDEILAVENDENIEVIMKAKTLVDQIVSSELFEKNDQGRYKIHAKITAITLMTASLGMMEDYGLTTKEPTPYYSGVSAWLGVRTETLRRWWANATVIMREQGALSLSAIQRSVLKQIEISELFTDALYLTKDELKELKKTPKGIAVMVKVVSQLLYNAKFLTVSGEAIANAGETKVTEGEGARHGVAVIVPDLITMPAIKKGKIQDVSDITDKE